MKKEKIMTMKIIFLRFYKLYNLRKWGKINFLKFILVSKKMKKKKNNNNNFSDFSSGWK